ncbi:protein FRA10AC1 [Pseudohyphozyma bogoriensis]|nr:protein FRA10AC1 [Pseudohyphozyma bogoriensis]
MSSSSRHRPKEKAYVQTTAPETAHERHQRLYRTAREAYSHGRAPPRPATKHDLDVLKERNQFIREEGVDPESLSWEDRLAAKWYSSLFREFAVVNLKHYKSGQIALRWRTEDEVLLGKGHLTCASLRCEYHEPATTDEPDPESNDPLVPTRLDEFEVPFGH